MLISPPENHELDAMLGRPNLVFGLVRRPVDYKAFRLLSTYDECGASSISRRLSTFSTIAP